MAEFRMPSLGADMESGTLVEWIKKPGDPVRRGDIVTVVETQKGAIEVEIFVDGVMGQQLVAVGTKVPVGTVLAMIDGVTEARTYQSAFPAPAVVAPEPVGLLKPPIGRQRASPAARKAAGELGVDFGRITGTGPSGAITLRDVEQAAREKPAATQEKLAAAPRGLDLAKMRDAIAAAMAHSKREIPHYYLATEIEFDRVLEWLERTNAVRTPENRLLPAVMTLKAVALAARNHPAFNGFYGPEGFRPSKEIHIGTAIAVRGGGLVAPALRDCDQRSVGDLMGAMRDLVARARVGRLRSSEVSDPTITVSSLGERGVEQMFGVIYPPQVAIAGFGSIVRKPVASGEEIKIRAVMTATLAADHRVSDGRAGALFLNEIARLLQEPDKL
jgi:pyruvate dehydrogenase E2 component (dihydrolipoamide acetyltransferase)